jgi:hypothetical protein
LGQHENKSDPGAKGLDDAGDDSGGGDKHDGDERMDETSLMTD